MGMSWYIPTRYGVGESIGCQEGVGVLFFSLASRDLAGLGWGLGNCLPGLDRPTYLEAFAGGEEGMCKVTGWM